MVVEKMSSYRGERNLRSSFPVHVPPAVLLVNDDYGIVISTLNCKKKKKKEKMKIASFGRYNDKYFVKSAIKMDCFELL